jgi:hypothetical protein
MKELPIEMPMVPQEFDEVGRGYWNCPDLDEKAHYTVEELEKLEGQIDNETRVPVIRSAANLISSLCLDGNHRPVLDFDVPARYEPSTTPGHGHLYIDKPLTWAQYEQLLIVLGEVGILEKGYVGAALRRGATFVRPPWVKKPGALPAVPEDDDDFDINKLIEAELEKDHLGG